MAAIQQDAQKKCEIKNRKPKIANRKSNFTRVRQNKHERGSSDIIIIVIKYNSMTSSPAVTIVFLPKNKLQPLYGTHCMPVRRK
jgi:hypothetical protein